MLSLGRILISDLVVTNLLIHSLPGIYDSTLPGHAFLTPKVFLHEIYTIYRKTSAKKNLHAERKMIIRSKIFTVASCTLILLIDKAMLAGKDLRMSVHCENHKRFPSRIFPYTVYVCICVYIYRYTYVQHDKYLRYVITMYLG